MPASPGEPAAIITGNSVTLNWTPPLGGSAPTRYLLEAIDADETVRFVNRAGRVLLGVDPKEEIEGRPLGLGRKGPDSRNTTQPVS